MTDPAPHESRVAWPQAWRAMASRHPPVRLFERVTDPGTWEAVVAAEMLTNPRVRQEVGEISMVPVNERVSGPGASWVMASFTHPRPSRFTGGGYGVYYAGAVLETAVREYAYHVGRAYRAAQRRLGESMTMRCVVGRVESTYIDIRGGYPKLHDPESYVASRAFGAEQRAAGRQGIVYDSVRHPGGECIAALRPNAVGLPQQGPHVALHFDGERMDRWFNTAAHEWRTL